MLDKGMVHNSVDTLVFSGSAERKVSEISYFVFRIFYALHNTKYAMVSIRFALNPSRKPLEF